MTPQTHSDLYTTAQLRAAEAAFQAAHPKISLLQRAGACLVRHAASLLARKKGARILVLAGPGNNGGDAWVAAAGLLKDGHALTVIGLGEQTFGEPAAKSAHAAYLKAKGEVRKDLPKNVRFDLVIDGLFGVGLSRAPSGAFADMIRIVNELRRSQGIPVIAVDIPSGLGAETGIAFGEAIEADRTVSFIGLKPGLFTAAGRDHAGEVFLETLGVERLAEPVSASGILLGADNVRRLIPERRHASHKGTYGNVGIIGGTDGMVGAAVLAARGALFMGPGKVLLGFAAKDAPVFDPLNPEIMVRRAEDLIGDAELAALALGMGLGTDRVAPRLVAAALSRTLPTVLDADALNVIAATPSLATLLAAEGQKSSTGAGFEAKTPEKSRQCSRFVLTPHPGEAARLLAQSSAEVQADRVKAAVTLARRFWSVVVLKGSGTVVAAPDGFYAINGSGNPGMASGGMGDALAGMIAAFLAQGLDTLDASRLAVYLHGAAADACIEHGMAPHGLTASEVIFEARTLLNSRLQEHSHGHTPAAGAT
ncbi:MAG TPA: NAD(P)H-hydrate dehydratase [Usitatibacteraceae bacterium]|nr:NAD(P)H-hydrate dehydratase [Usitatibacteraceae bacterium]